MLTIDRQKIILDYLRSNKSAKLADLMELLDTSISTLRRDLKDLDDSGLVERVHGGVVLVDQSDESPVIQRATSQAEAKRRIGEAAAALVKDGSTIMITGGTTTEAMVPFLAVKSNLTVITNALNVAYYLSRYPAVAVVVLGGWLRHSELSLLGHLTVQALQDLRAEQLFHGTFGFDPEYGLGGSYMQEVQTDRHMIAAARELVVLADHSKFEQSGTVRLTPIESVSTVVTDTGAPAAAVRALQARGIKVIQV